MGLRIFGTPLYAYACVYFFVFILQVAQSQRSPGTQQGEQQRAALRQTLQWSHNGKIFSILSQGSEYQPPRRRGAPQEQVQARPVTIIRDANVRPQDTSSQQQQPPRPTSGAHSPGGLPPPLQRLVRGREHRQHPRERPGERAEPQRSSRANDTQDKVTVSPPLPRRQDMMVGDDPYNDPYKSMDGDNPYYNYYDVYERPRPRPRPGYGTRDHQYGKAVESAHKTTSEVVYLIDMNHQGLLRMLKRFWCIKEEISQGSGSRSGTRYLDISRLINYHQ